MNPTVTIITVFHNREPYVEKSVWSLLDQKYNETEIIAIDDGSTDGTVDQLRKLEAPNLRVESGVNRGFVQCMIEAVQQARGEFIAVHGSGDISSPDRIESQVERMQSNSAIGVVGCYVVNDSATGAGQEEIFAPPRGLNFRETLLKRNLFTHGEVMFRKSVYEKAGGYRSFFKYAQDRDLWLRMSAVCEYDIVEQPLYRRFRLPGGVSRDPTKLIYQAYLSEFAVYCAKEVDAGRQDPLDTHGPAAALVRSRSPAVADRLVTLGAKWLAEGDAAGAEMVRAGLMEGPSLSRRLLALAASNPLGVDLLAAILSRRDGSKRADAKNRQPGMAKLSV